MRCLSECHNTSHSPAVLDIITPVSPSLSPVGVVTKVPTTACASVSDGGGVVAAGVVDTVEGVEI